MKTLSTLFIAMLFIASTALADGQNEYLRAAYSVYSSNDTNVVLAGSLSDDNSYTATNLNMVTGTAETYQLDVDNSTELLDVQMNTAARLTYFFTYKKIYIYDFGATEPKRVITIDNNSTNFGVSSDGTKIYSYDNMQDYVSIFDATSGERLDRFFVNSFEGKNKFGIFNSAKDEFLLKDGNTFYVWSIANKAQDREITVIKSSENFKFADNGNVLAYTVGGEVVIANSADGEVTYRKEFGYSSIDRFEFSPNMNYLIVVNDPITFSVFDMMNKTILIDSKILLDNNNYVPLYYYVNNDNSRAVAAEIVSDDCDNSDEIPIATYSYFLYKTDGYKKIVSAPTGFIPRPEAAIVSKDNKILVLTGYNFFKSLTSAIVDNKENFIKYVNVAGIPQTFLEDNNRIAFIEKGIFKVYNMETEVFEREFDTGMESYNDVYFFANGGGRLVITDDSEIKVYDYSTFAVLYTFNYNDLGLEPTDISFDNNSTISVYSLKRLHKFDVYTGETSDTPITNMDPANELVDVSISGRYLLFITSNNQFMVYDNKLKEEVYKDSPSVVNGDIKYLNAGFFGNHEMMWIRYEKNPMDRYPQVAKFDFVSKKTEAMFGDKEPIISNDGSLYYSHYCPRTYEIGAIRDSQTSVESITAIIGSVYPNPASDFIKLDMNASSLNSSVEIYDAYGKQVMSVIYTGEEIDISKLTAGVYFVKTPSYSYKFIKL
jgi:hypothetical protein